MEEIKEKENRWGKYYRISRKLFVAGKAYKVSQETKDLNVRHAEWRLTRSQMISILKNTKPEDWLFKSLGHFDGMIDGWAYDNEDWRPATASTIAWVIKQLEDFDGYYVDYIAGLEDRYGNKLEPNTFDIWNLAIHHFMLKPAKSIVVFDASLAVQYVV